MIRYIFLFFLTCVIFSNGVHADTVLKVKKLAENTYALIGPTTNRDTKNLGNNANFGVVVTDEGVVLIDPGATHKGAKMIHESVKTITDKPITVVINTGGQDHRWLGNAYFKSLGAHIIANEKAVTDQKTRLQDQLSRLDSLIGDNGLDGTVAAYADETFSEEKILNIGNTPIEINHAGHAHTPGDSFVWLPNHRVMFTGDIVYVDRMLGVGSQSAHKSWISAFEAMAAKQPKIVVAGHGDIADLAKAKSDSYDYLVFLRESVQAFMEGGNGMEEIGSIDQSRFKYLDNYDTLKGRNAQRVYEELEWE